MNILNFSYLMKILSFSLFIFRDNCKTKKTYKNNIVCHRLINKTKTKNIYNMIHVWPHMLKHVFIYLWLFTKKIYTIQIDWKLTIFLYTISNSVKLQLSHIFSFDTFCYNPHIYVSQHQKYMNHYIEHWGNICWITISQKIIIINKAYFLSWCCNCLVSVLKLHFIFKKYHKSGYFTFIVLQT